ncbi:MAG: AI-2E family transporter [Clostridia bacterium]|nr:AI-2E family transporter [Clostridia bacterium]
MKEVKKSWTKWLYWFTFAVAVIFVYKTIDSFSEIVYWLKNLISILMPFIIGVLIAYLFYIPCRKLEFAYRKVKLRFISKKARLLSIFTVYVIAILICTLGIKFVIPNITKSIIDLTNNLQGYYNNTLETINNLPEDSIFNKINADQIIQEIKQIDLSKYISLSSIADYAKGAMGIVSDIFGFFVAIIVSIYILIERTEILSFIKKLLKVTVKSNTYKNIGKYFNETNNVFFKFISGQLIDAVVVGILTSIAMWILGVKYAVLLGVLIAVSNLIPYIGAIIGVTIAVIITIFTGGLSQAIWMAIIVIILQQIDANIINPKIIGNTLKISPILVIFAVTVGGAYFGILGMFLAVPIIAVIKILILDYIEFKNKQIE